MENGICEVEEEDVVIKGSELYNVLTEMGYTDFESVSIDRIGLNKEQSLSHPPIRRSLLHQVCENFSFFCNKLSEAQPFKNDLQRIILQAEFLLDDHALQVQNFLSHESKDSLRSFLQWLPMTSSVAVLLVASKKSKSALPIFASTGVLCNSLYSKYLQWSMKKQLKSLVQTQNKVYYLFNKCLNILKYDFKMKPSRWKCEETFTDLNSERLKYLQPILETLLTAMKRIAKLYHFTGEILLDMLSDHERQSNLLTSLDKDDFGGGEVTYESIKKCYYAYILAQSETSQLLAICCNNIKSHVARVSERTIRNLIRKLNDTLECDYKRISKFIDQYQSCKVMPVKRRYGGSATSKWQDLFVHLDLTSSRLQVAYSHLNSMINDINSYKNDNADDGFIEKISEKMEEAYKNIENARNFAEFSSLLIAKHQYIDSKGNQALENSKPLTDKLDEQTELPLIGDRDLDIVDEVFEEYIKEIYLKPLCEEGDELTVGSLRFDKLLANNLMKELRLALIEKKKTMRERESKALQRMYQKITNGSDSVPLPPPMPNFELDDPEVDHEVRIPVPLPRKKKVICLETKYDSSDDNVEEEKIVPMQRFQLTPRPPNFPTQLRIRENPPTTDKNCDKFQLPQVNVGFLSHQEEETFIGSGEQSEEEEEACDSDDELSCTGQDTETIQL